MAIKQGNIKELIQKHQDDEELVDAIQTLDTVLDDDEADPWLISEAFDSLMDILKGYWLAEQEIENS